MVKIQLDFAYSEELQQFLHLLHRHSARMGAFIPVGPGGGNPLVELEFPDRGRLLSFLAEYDGDNGEADYLATLAY